ncbi:hypothetical protein CEUSTIGMA_g11277.t1 [Chlamydomonas eustigma]|uniref:Uncharacterized protein n=1 Tax=Chlamydomonas eustigma TaxID=1157962 RepID=A0A250XLT2_9CHLO|nr:hypothetical protein CEUSTIGMA_g11277.t1 [Chlamydomonas eustigma]|eukprot:GAX83852.1 hypothetical protein CEUSTIGMA_g11277.t1 [Chlamydomonas eustigma]
MWPDSVESASRIKNSPIERYALAPHWLVASFSARGVQGYWGQHPGHTVQQVRVQVLYWGQHPGHAVQQVRVQALYWGQHPGHAVQQVRVQALYWGQHPGHAVQQVRVQALYWGQHPGHAVQQDRPLPQAVALVPCLDLGKLIRSLEDFKVR